MATTSTATQETTAGADPRGPADVVETAPRPGVTSVASSPAR